MGPCLPQERLSTSFEMSVSRYDVKGKFSCLSKIQHKRLHEMMKEEFIPGTGVEPQWFYCNSTVSSVVLILVMLLWILPYCVLLCMCIEMICRRDSKLMALCKTKGNSTAFAEDLSPSLRPRQKWPPFCRRPFQMHFLEWKYINFD